MLKAQRQAIDAIDRELVQLFEKRTRIVEEVAQIKLDNHLPVLDASREQLVIEKVQSYLTDTSLSQDLADLYTEIMRLSRLHQHKWLVQQKDTH